MIRELKNKINKKNILATIVFSAIILVFVFFGFQTGGPGMVGYAARVNSKVITLRDLQMASERLAQFYSAFMGGQQANNEMFMAQIRSSALNQLIQREVLLQGAKKAGFTASDAEIAEFIRNVPQFQKDGVFQRSAYQAFIDSQGLSTSRFEEQIRDDIILNRIQSVVSGSFEPFKSEITKLTKLKEKTITLDYVNLKNINFEKHVSVSDSEVTSFLENKDNQLKVQLEFGNNKEAYKDQTLEAVQNDIAKKILKDEKAEKLLSEMEVAAQNAGQIESLLKKYNATWSKSTPVTLDADQIPEIGASDKLSTEIAKLEKTGQMIPEVIRTSQGDFLIKLKAVETKKADPAIAGLADQIKNQRAQDLIGQWSESLSKDFTIVRNESLFSTPQ